MTIDYSQPIPRHPAIVARMRKRRRRWIIASLILAIVLTSLFGVQSIHWANFQRREFRDQKTLFGWVVYENDYALPERTPLAGVTGSWVIVGMNPSMIYWNLDHTPLWISEFYLKKSLTTLDQATNLSAQQKQLLEDQMWAAASASNFYDIRAIEEEILKLQLKPAMPQPDQTPSTMQKSQ